MNTTMKSEFEIEGNCVEIKCRDIGKQNIIPQNNRIKSSKNIHDVLFFELYVYFEFRFHSYPRISIEIQISKVTFN